MEAYDKLCLMVCWSEGTLLQSNKLATLSKKINLVDIISSMLLNVLRISSAGTVAIDEAHS